MITKACINDFKIITSLAIKLWNDSDLLELEKEFYELLHKDNVACFIK